MKQLKILIVRCLLFFYLSSSYLSAIHFHNKTFNPNSECKICIIVKNLNSGDGSAIASDSLFYIFNYEAIFFKIKRVQENILKGFNANAPPIS